MAVRDGYLVGAAGGSHWCHTALRTKMTRPANVALIDWAHDVFVPELRKRMEVEPEDDDELILACPGELVTLESGMLQDHEDDCAVIGHASVALGALHALRDEATPETRARRALQVAAWLVPSVAAPFRLVNTDGVVCVL